MECATLVELIRAGLDLDIPFLVARGEAVVFFVGDVDVEYTYVPSVGLYCPGEGGI